MKTNQRIIGGKRAKKPIPWQVAVIGNYKHKTNWGTIETTGSRIRCGGTILNEETILTAAHCFRPLGNGYPGCDINKKYTVVCILVQTRDLTIILVKYQYTYQVSVY